MKLLLDMNFSPLWLTLLAQHGLHAVHWSSLGLADDRDDDILDYAGRNGYVVLTFDLDFGIALSRTDRIGPSVVQVRALTQKPHLIADQVIAAILRMTPELEQGALLTVHLERTRIRMLPFGREP